MKPFLIFDFAPDPIWISLYMWKCSNECKAMPPAVPVCWWESWRQSLCWPSLPDPSLVPCSLPVPAIIEFLCSYFLQLCLKFRLAVVLINLEMVFVVARGTVTVCCGSGSVPLTNGSRSGSDSFLQWLKGCKKNFIFFLITYPQAHNLQSSKLNFC
jgi:hypothetical protein